MADEDYGDGDGYFFDDDDYLYVEDDYAVADELAETQVPSPGYINTNPELDMENYEYDIYEYFGELEYGQDEYWDSAVEQIQQSSQRTETTGGKRKREDFAPQRTKRRKVSKTQDADGEGSESVADNVIFKPFGAQVPPLPPKKRENTEFALLPDWKARFSGDSARTPTKRAMPAEMQQAAEAAADDDTPTKPLGRNADLGEDEDWEDEDEEEDEGGDDDMQDALAGLDPDMLKAILKQKLSETGLGNMDEAALEQAIAKMLAGSSDDAAGDLTDLLLGQATEGGDTAVSGWLSGQGVQLEAEDDEGSVSGEAAPVEPGRAGAMQISPSDSAVGMGSGKPKGSKLSKSVTLKSAATEATGVLDQGTALATDKAATAANAATTGDDDAATASASGRKRKLGAADASAAQPSKRRQAARGESSQESEPNSTSRRGGKRGKGTAAAKSGD